MAAKRKYPVGLSIVLPTELRRALDQIADDENDSLGFIVRRACVREVERVARLKARAQAKAAAEASDVA